MSKYMETRELEIFSRQKNIMDRLGITAPVVFDIGANRGQSIESYRKYFPKGIFHSFEPNPEMAEEFEEHYAHDPLVSLYRTALAEAEGSLPFYKTAIPEASSLLAPCELLTKLSNSNKYSYELLQVPVTTMDLWMEKQTKCQIDILKIDVQGAELRVLQGAKTLLANQAISVIYLEITHAETYDGQATFAELINYLSVACGYILWDILPFVYTVSGKVWVSNALFVSRTAADKVDQICRATLK